MDTLQEFLETIPDEDHRAKLQHVIEWAQREFPDLKLEIKWNQPMLTHHGTFIIAFSAAKNYFTVAPEIQVLSEYLGRIKETGYGHTKMKFQIRWNQDVNYDLLRDIITRCMEFKKGSTTFWAQ